MYVGHLLVVRRSLVESVGGLDSTYDGVQDFELMLRVAERTDRIEHVPRILYHWRKLPGSVASSTSAKPGLSELQARAVTAHLERLGIAGVRAAEPGAPAPGDRAPEAARALAARDRDRPDEGRAASTSAAASSRSSRARRTRTSACSSSTPARPTRRRGALFERYPVDVLPFEGRFNFSRA